MGVMILATSKPFSTISYNTIEWFRDKCDSLVSSGILFSYAYIKHTDESPSKSSKPHNYHIHAYFVPNKRIDLVHFLNEFKQIHPSCVDPLCCLPFRLNNGDNADDWTLYVLHNDNYLRVHHSHDDGESIPYQVGDIVHSPYFELDRAYHTGLSKLQGTQCGIMTALKEGTSGVSLVLDGAPVALVGMCQRVLSGSDYTALVRDYNDMQSNYTILLQNYKFIESFLLKHGYVLTLSKSDSRYVESIDYNNGVQLSFESLMRTGKKDKLE